MKLSKDAFVFTVKVEIGDYMRPPVAKGDAWIVMREPSARELMVISSGKGDAIAALDSSAKLLPSIIVDHNFESETGKMTSQDVADMLSSSSDVFSYILTTWQEALPLGKRSPAS